MFIWPERSIETDGSGLEAEACTDTICALTPKTRSQLKAFASMRFSQRIAWCRLFADLAP
jgi:hypothetical protein